MTKTIPPSRARAEAEAHAINNHARKPRPDESWAPGHDATTLNAGRPAAAAHTDKAPAAPPKVKPKPAPLTAEEVAAKSLKAERLALWAVMSRWVGNPTHPEHRDNLRNAMRVFELQHHMRSDRAAAQPHQPTATA